MLIFAGAIVLAYSGVAWKRHGVELALSLGTLGLAMLVLAVSA